MIKVESRLRVSRGEADGDTGGAIQRLRRIVDLATEPELPVGTRVRVEEDEVVYTSVGTPAEQIEARLGWTQGNVWVPAHALEYMSERHPEIRNPIGAIAWILMNPGHVNEEPGKSEMRFLVDASDLREAGFLRARSVKLVDVIVELREVDDNVVLRAFHISPTRQAPRGRRRWP